VDIGSIPVRASILGIMSCDFLFPTADKNLVLASIVRRLLAVRQVIASHLEQLLPL